MRFKKMFAFSMVIVMLLGSLPITMREVSAASGGSGTVVDPYQIMTAADLNDVRNDLNAYYILCNDIDLSAYLNWVPLGDVQNPFTGRLNGNNYTITGLKIGSVGAPSTAYSYTGLFGYINQYGVVHDLGVDVAIYNNSGYASGGIAGKSEGYLVNCHTSGTLVSTAVDSNTGGIVGENAGNLVNCYNTSNITGGSCKALAVIGTGGIAGINTGENGITNCYNAGIVSDSEGEKLGKTGTIVGYSDHGFVQNCYWDRELCPIIRGGYNTGGYIKSGGVLGLVTNAMKGAAINGTEYIFDITGKKTVIDGTLADLMNQGRGAIRPEQLPSGVKASAWGQDSGNVNNGYPVFTKASTSGVFSGGSGIITDPYIIKTQEQLQNIKNNTVPYTLASPLPDFSRANTFFMGGYYQLANDIDITGPFLYCDVKVHGYEYSGFNGELDGNGYCIKFTEGLNMDDSNISGSLFYLIGRYGVVKNLAIECEDTPLISGFAFANCGLIANCRITGTMDRKDIYHSSAICGINAGDIINCYSSADVTANHDAGGICKNLAGGTGVIANSCTTGNVYSREFGASGVVVQPGDGVGIGVMNCYTAGNITADNADAYGANGFMSYSSSVGYINCYWNSSATQVEAGNILSPTRGYAYGGYECDTNSLPIGVSSEVMKGQNASIEYSDAPNDTSDKKIAQSFLEALNRGRRAVGEDFYWESAPYDQPGFYPALLHQEELYPWVYVSGVNNDYPIPFKPQTPNITIQPSGKTITSGNTLTFHTAAAEVRDGGTLSYQWQKSTDGASWINVTDGTGGGSDTYTTGTLSTGNSKEKYRCVIANTRYGITTTVATDIAMITVKPSILPLTQTVEAGNSVTFCVDSAGPYQWQVSTDGGANWTDITGATLPYYTTAVLVIGDNGKKYRCTIGSATGLTSVITTDAATLTVTDPTITVTGVALTPSTVSVQKGNTYTFGVAVTGTNNPSQSVTWSVTGNNSPTTTISNTGVLKVASDETAVTLMVKAISVADPARSTTATVTVTNVPATVSSVTITPKTVTAVTGSTITFSAAVSGTNSPTQDVSWGVSGNNSVSTTISSTGVLSIAADETASAFTVTAVASADTTKFDSATVTITSTPLPSPTVSAVTVTPTTASIAKGNTHTFSAAVIGTNNPPQTIDWSITGNNSPATLINSSGVLAVASDETATTLTIRAASTLNSAVTGTATVAITEIASTVPTVDIVTVNPTAATVAKGSTMPFGAVVTGSNSPAQTVIFSVSGNTSVGTVIGSNGLLIVGADETAALLTVTATSTVDNTKYGTASVMVTNASQPSTVTYVAVLTSNSSVQAGMTRTFTAVVAGTNDPAQTVTWSISGNNSASTSINSTGVLTVGSNETAPTLTVMATSTLDNTKTGTAAVVLIYPTNSSTGGGTTGDGSSDKGGAVGGGAAGGGPTGAAANEPLPIMEGSNRKGWEAIKKQLEESINGNISSGADLNDTENSKDRSDLDIKVNLNGNTLVPKELFESIHGQNVTVTLVQTDGIEWIINGKDIGFDNNEELTMKDIDLKVVLGEVNLSKDLVENLTASGASFETMSITHEGSFGFPATLRLNLDKVKQGMIANLYYLNQVTNKLELQTTGKIDADGNVNLDFVHASDYVIVMDKGETLAKLAEQSIVTPAAKTLYVGGTKGKSASVKLELPGQLTSAIEAGACSYSVTYTSSNEKVARVSKTGTIKALKAGKATITTTMDINGTKVDFRTMVTVKKAYIMITKDTDNAMKIGESYTCRIKGYGVETAGAIWKTTKKSIVVISKNTGKATAKSIGTDYIVATVGTIKAKMKVTVK